MATPSTIILIGPERAGKSTVGHLVTHPAFQTLATQVVYTEGKTPAAICEEHLSA